MFQKLVSHNEDIGRLVSKGYAVGFDDGYLIVRDIPYLDAQLQLQTGAFVTKLVQIDHEERVEQDDHQVFFAGSAPYGLDGQPIPNLGGGNTTLALSKTNEDVVVQRSFSNKPKVNGVLVGFKDFFEKIESYVTVVSGPAIEKHGANPLTFRVVEAVPDSVFKFHDTLTSRAEIVDLSAHFNADVVAVIGLGGTGAYLLDLLVKTPVREIRGFDADIFHVHTAFRSPGALQDSELGQRKADVYRSRYETLREGLKVESINIDSDSGGLLDGVTFAFVAIDKGSSRKEIFELLISKGIPFIDVGMGLSRKQGMLGGMARVTYFAPESARESMQKDLVDLTDSPDDEYRRNIQIAELNALNACLAVIRFKQLRGFYLDEASYSHLLFGIGDVQILGLTD
jgi:molybdopterin/thiamine biosynthesis adenylyltransferase